MIQVVCLGGGTGQSTLLAALKQNPAFTPTAIVSMFDSGGSSGVLRDRLGVLPPSDLQRCMAALSPYPYVRDILNERIMVGEPPYHTGGNLLMATLEKEYGRHNAIEVLADLFRIQGRVIPVSQDAGHLRAVFTDDTDADNEVAVDEGIKAGKIIDRMVIEPQPLVNSEATTALADADVIIIGPGSFYTSIVPNILVPGIREAINNSAAPIFWVMNLMAEGAQFEHHTDVAAVAAHWNEWLDLERLPAKVIVNSLMPSSESVAEFSAEHKYPVIASNGIFDGRLCRAPLWQDSRLARHDVDELARTLSISIPQLLRRGRFAYSK
jgi:uncharacterized cofD-like protein